MAKKKKSKKKQKGENLNFLSKDTLVQQGKQFLGSKQFRKARDVYKILFAKYGDDFKKDLIESYVGIIQ